MATSIKISEFSTITSTDSTTKIPVVTGSPYSNKTIKITDLFDSPKFTGTITVPSATALGTSKTKPATEAAVKSIVSTSPLTITNGKASDYHQIAISKGVCIFNLGPGEDSLVRLPSDSEEGSILTIIVRGMAGIGLTSYLDTDMYLDGVNLTTNILTVDTGSISIIYDGTEWYTISKYTL